jgi:serine/threonine protein phosphatase PrpC
MKAKKKKMEEASMRKSPQADRKMQFKYSCRTRQGVLASNPNKTNQDRMLIKTKIGGMERTLFAVADGHGAYGHLVAQHVVQNYGSLAEKEFSTKSVEESLPSIYDELQKSLINSEINSSCSGSTLVSVVLEDSNITCGNVGDSRAILARQGTCFGM